MPKPKILGLILGLLLAVFLTGCATANNPQDVRSVHYSGGEFSSKKYKNCLEPSERSGFDPGDGYYGYPTRQISYDATGGDRAESGRFKVVSDDNAELYVPVTVTFRLKSDCKTLRQFHETIGSRFAAAIKPGDDNNDDGESGTSADYPQGWVDLLNYVIGKPLDATLDRVAQKYKWREVWNNEGVRAELEAAVQENIDDLVARQAGGNFFENYSVLVLKPDPVDEKLKLAISDEQANIAQANSQKEKAEADKATAEAQTELAKAEAAKQRAVIDGYGGIDNYLKAQCIDKGCNPYQPTYIYGGAK